MDHAKNICNVNDKHAGPQTHEIVEIVSNTYACSCLPILLYTLEKFIQPVLGYFQVYN
jgi:hypothetical protein